ncbi:hypothetical protein [Streptomyces sp. NPDC019937]|uniref:hypothetical protein n=1 Tax=Streptomyces sp. NPDC019937 TaxID=3154787 RepID=UPI0033EA0E6C
MDHVDWFGLSGWRWMFILEGAPAVLLGIACFFVLTERPADATWLTLTLAVRVSSAPRAARARAR